MPCRELRTRASPGTGIWLGDSLKPRGETRVIQALVAPGRAHSPLLPVKACERGTCGLCRGAFLPGVQGWVCGLAGGMSGCLPACVSGERLGGGSSREETRRKKEEKPPYPCGFACSSAFCSVAGRIGRLPSGPRPRRAARSRRACAQFPRLPLRARTPPASSTALGTAAAGLCSLSWGRTRGWRMPPSPPLGPPPAKSRSCQTWRRVVPAGVRAHPPASQLLVAGLR